MRFLAMLSTIKLITFRFIFSTFATVTIFGQVYSQAYFWGNQGKIALQIDSSKIAIRVPLSQQVNLLSTINATNNIDSVIVLSNTTLLVILNQKIHPRAFTELTQMPNVKVFVGHSTLDGLDLFPTDKITLELKEGIEFKSILSDHLSIIESYSENKYGVFSLKVTKSASLALANSIYESGIVKYCHPEFIVKITKFNNDPLFPEQYYLKNTGQFGWTPGVDIKMEGAWNISKGLFPVRVAVIDDGVEPHPDLGNRVLQGYTPPGSSNLYGAPANDQHGHGQSCAGIIAATANNNLGITGILPCGEIIPVNILGYSGLSTTDQANAIDWAWDQGQAAVLSNSWGIQKNVNFPDISAAITRARTMGRNNKGSVVVFASGNDNVNSNGVFFPGSADGVLTIGALDGNGIIWNYSDRGPEMDLVAPSGNKSFLGDIRTIDRVGIKGFEPGDFTNRFGGTSASTPMVAAIAALMISVNPNLTEQEVVEILRNTAQDIGAPGFDNTHGFGLVNAQASLLAVQPNIVGQNFVCTSQSQFSVNVPSGSSVTWTVSSNISIVSGQGSSTVILKALSSGLRGPGTINASVTNNCGSVTNFKQKNVWVGRPNTPPDIITGDISPNIGHAKRYFSLTPAQGATTHEWILPYNNSNCNYCWSFYTISTPFDIWALVGEDAGYMQFRGVNVCGAGGAQLLYITPTGQGGCNPCQIVSPFPNPTSGNLSIQYNIEDLGKVVNLDLKNETMLPFEVEFSLKKENGEVIYLTKSSEINPILELQNISNGLYYLNINYIGKGSDIIRIVVDK